MIDNLVRDFQILSKADSLIGKIWLGVIIRRLSLFASAGLIAAFGLGMANIAGFYALQAPAGPVGASAIIALVDFVLAAIAVLVARNAGPGPEIELAFDVRKMAVDSIQADARDLKATIDALGQEVRDAKETILRFAHSPLDTAAEKLIIPAAISIVRGLRSKADHA
jgi:hypothetical protein